MLTDEVTDGAGNPTLSRLLYALFFFIVPYCIGVFIAEKKKLLYMRFISKKILSLQRI